MFVSVPIDELLVAGRPPANCIVGIGGGSDMVELFPAALLPPPISLFGLEVSGSESFPLDASGRRSNEEAEDEECGSE